MRKIAKYFVIALAVFVFGFLVVRITDEYSEKKEVEKRIQTLPAAEFVSLSGERVDLHDFDPKKHMVIVYFHPECDHCHYEAQEIGQNVNAFNNCQLVMVTSDDSLKRIENFCSEYHLWDIDNFDVLIDKENQFKKVFGKAVIPSVYIYDENQKLTKRFFGETKPEAIIMEIS